MRNVWYTCPFVPPEWIAAHGLAPRRRLVSSASVSASAGVAEGICPYANASIGAWAPPGGSDAVIVTTLCDQMRRAHEQPAAAGLADRLFLMHVPTTWRNANAHRLYLAELQRLGRFLVSLGGTDPSPGRLADVMRAYDVARRDLLARRGRLAARAFAEALARFQDEGLPCDAGVCLPVDKSSSTSRCERGHKHRGHGTLPANGAGVPPCGPGVAVVGGPLMAEDFAMLDRIEQLGGRVVLNATIGAELTMPRPVDRRRLAEGPLGELADAYFGHIPHPARRPNSGLYRYLRREFAGRGVAGVLLARRVWCDVWHGELGRLRQWAPCPVVGLELTDDTGGAVHADARIQSLIETLT